MVIHRVILDPCGRRREGIMPEFLNKLLYSSFLSLKPDIISTFSLCNMVSRAVLSQLHWHQNITCTYSVNVDENDSHHIRT